MSELDGGADKTTDATVSGEDEETSCRTAATTPPEAMGRAAAATVTATAAAAVEVACAEEINSP